MTTKNKNILIAEDDKDILEAMGMVLTDAGYSVTLASTGQKALKLARDNPALILLDIRLAGTDGRDICRKIKSDKETSNIPVVFVSAAKEIEDKTAEACADGYVAKPFEIKDLVKTVAKFVN